MSWVFMCALWFVLGFSSTAALLCVFTAIVTGGARAVGSAGAFAMVVFVGIFCGGNGVLVRMCSLACALLCVLLVVSCSYPDQSELMVLGRSIHESNAPVHHAIDSLGLPAALHDVARGPGDAVIVIVALRHMVLSWRAFLFHMSLLHSHILSLHPVQGVQNQERLGGQQWWAVQEEAGAETT